MVSPSSEDKDQINILNLSAQIPAYFFSHPCLSTHSLYPESGTLGFFSPSNVSASRQWKPLDMLFPLSETPYNLPDHPKLLCSLYMSAQLQV